MRVLLALFLLLLPATAHAVETVKSPSVTRGELGFEHKGKYEHDANAARDGRKEVNLVLSYGITHYWMTEAEAIFDQPAGGAMDYASFEWENVVRVATQKEIGIDLALHQALTFGDHAAYSHSYMFGLIARHTIDAFSFTGNARLARDFGDIAVEGASLIYRGQALYSYNSWLKPGIEVYGDTRKRDAFRNQSLKIGPVLKGGFALSDNHELGYELGYSFGVTPATPDGTLRWKLEYNIALN